MSLEEDIVKGIAAWSSVSSRVRPTSTPPCDFVSPLRASLPPEERTSRRGLNLTLPRPKPNWSVTIQEMNKLDFTNSQVWVENSNEIIVYNRFDGKPESVIPNDTKSWNNRSGFAYAPVRTGSMINLLQIYKRKISLLNPVGFWSHWTAEFGQDILSVFPHNKSNMAVVVTANNEHRRVCLETGTIEEQVFKPKFLETWNAIYTDHCHLYTFQSGGKLTAFGVYDGEEKWTTSIGSDWEFFPTQSVSDLLMKNKKKGSKIISWIDGTVTATLPNDIAYANHELIVTYQSGKATFHNTLGKSINTLDMEGDDIISLQNESSDFYVLRLDCNGFVGEVSKINARTSQEEQVAFIESDSPIELFGANATGPDTIITIDRNKKLTHYNMPK